MTRTRTRWSGCAVSALLALSLLVSACADPGAVASVAAVADAQRSMTQASGHRVAHRPPAVPLGAGLVHFPNGATAWVNSHPNDPRAALIRTRIARHPTALWLTGDESFGNLARDAAMARATDRTMLLTLWNIPQRYDGLTALSPVTLGEYERWISRVAAGLRGNRAIIVLEPDSLWFYDRLPSDAARRTRLAAMRYAVRTINAADPRARVYIDAGTSSGSVTPVRMAALLVAVGVRHAAGYAVDVSSYAPTKAIQAYAHGIRAALKARGIADPRYVTDTGRNGASTWNHDWCNPSSQRLGVVPQVVRSWDGRDLDLWVKAPGTSDGDCGAAGTGAGSYGGQFLPKLAYRMITG